MLKPPKVSVIVLNWNQTELTVNCVNSILKQDFRDFEIILIDNASDDNSFEIFEREFSGNERIRLIKNKENLGYAEGNNIGAKIAKGKFIVIQNNDTLVEKKWLQEMVKAIENDEKIALVTANILNVPSADKIPEYRKLFSKRTWWTIGFLGYGIDLENNERGKPIDVFAVNGCSFIYRKSLVGEEPFDKDYFIYAEETKLSWLMRLKGYDIKIAPEANVFHLHNMVRKSNTKMDKYFTFLGERNKIMNWLTFYEMKNLIKLSPIYFIGLLFLNLSDLRKIPYRVSSYFWILTHQRIVLKKRNEIQKQRKVSDSEVVKYMSCRFNNEKIFRSRFLKSLVRLLNGFSCLYFRTMRLRTIELR